MTSGSGEAAPNGPSQTVVLHSDAQRWRKASAKLATRRAAALDLRKTGFSFRQIAARLDVSVFTAKADVDFALATLCPPEDVEAVRQLHLDRLDHLLTLAMAHVEAGNLAAIDRALAIETRRSKLLGLDAPTKVEHSGEVTVTQQAAVLVDELARRRRSA